MLKEIDLDNVQSDDTLSFCLENFLGYASHAIQDKAIPNFVDGLLPTQRRYLLAMQDLKAFPGRKTIKSTVAGARLTGWYSPQGNGYGVLVNMSQDYKVPIMLTNPEGNWGEQENFIPAAERYTETALSKFAMEALLKDLPSARTPSDKDPHGIVPCKVNWEGSLLEEQYLPARLPVLLLNGSSGIAVGIAQTFQPLEYYSLLKEVKRFLNEGRIDYSNLRPGHPTNCACITSQDEFISALQSGSGNLRLAARYEVGRDKSGTAHSIILTAVAPYTSLNAIGDAFNAWRRADSRCPFKSFRNESSNSEIRLVFEFKSAEKPKNEAAFQLALKQLYKKLSLITSASIKMVALKGRYPVQYTVDTFIHDWVEERANIIGRIAKIKAERLLVEKHRFDILNFIRQCIDSVIDIIKESKTMTEMFNRFTDLHRINAKDQPDLTKEDIQIILSINLKQLSKMSEAEILTKGKAVFKEWEIQNELASNYVKQIDQIKDDIDWFLEHGETLGVRQTNTTFDEDLATMLTAQIKEVRKALPKGKHPFVEYTDKNFSPGLDILCQTAGGFFMRVPTGSVKSQPMTPKFAINDDKIQFACFMKQTYIIFLTDQGKFFKLFVGDLEPNQPYHYKKILEMAGQNTKGVGEIYMIPLIDDEPTHMFLYLYDGSVKKFPLSSVTSMRATIKLPQPVVWACFIKDRLPNVKPGKETVDFLNLKKIKDQTPKRQARLPGILNLGMPTRILNGLAVNRSGKTIFKIKVD